MVRARWTAVFRDRRGLDTAFASNRRRWFGDPAAAGADHHVRPDLRWRDLRDRGSQHGCEHNDLGQPSAATLVIGVYAAGSFVVGLIVGALKLTMPLQRRLASAVALIALTTLPLLVVDTVPLLALAIFVSGVGVSPTFITAFGLIERRERC